MKYIAKRNTWFKEGSKCKLIEKLEDDADINPGHGRIIRSEGMGLFSGTRICLNPEIEGWRPRELEYNSEEVCCFSEFNIIED